MTVPSDAALIRALRGTVSKKLDPKKGTPLDKKDFGLEVCYVKKVYFEKGLVLVKYRDIEVPPFLAMWLSPLPLVSSGEMWQPPHEGEEDYEICKETGHKAIVPSEKEMGIVASLGGDHSSKGSVFLGFIRMPGEDELPEPEA